MSGTVDGNRSSASTRIVLGTDNAGEALFERLFLRSTMSGSRPVVVSGRIKTLITNPR
jgi:hypothetical protein